MRDSVRLGIGDVTVYIGSRMLRTEIIEETETNRFSDFFGLYGQQSSSSGFSTTRCTRTTRSTILVVLVHLIRIEPIIKIPASNHVDPTTLQHQARQNHIKYQHSTSPNITKKNIDPCIRKNATIQIFAPSISHRSHPDTRLLEKTDSSCLTPHQTMMSQWCHSLPEIFVRHGELSLLLHVGRVHDAHDRHSSVPHDELALPPLQLSVLIAERVLVTQLRHLDHLGGQDEYENSTDREEETSPTKSIPPSIPFQLHSQK